MMDNSQELQKLFTRRALLVGAGQIGVLGLLIGRMAQLQIFKHAKYVTLAEDNRINTTLLPPERGLITDRYGVPLAENRQSYRLLYVPERGEKIDTILQELHSLIKWQPHQIERIKRDIARQSRRLPVLLSDQLSWEQLTSIEVQLPQLPGVEVTEGQVRYYPLRDAAAHVVGYVAPPTIKDLQTDKDPVLGMPGFQVGRMGLEREYDKKLRGVTGQAEQEVNASGRQVRLLHKTPPNAGQNLQLTIDAELQLYTQTRLAETRSASAVIMDSFTGAIYAWGSYPAFDPNNFAQGIPQSLWQDLNTDITAPLTNKVVAGQYPPGSTFKMVTALAGLETGFITPSRRVHCPGYLMVGNHRFHCWKKPGHGTIDVVGALRESCDVFFYQVAREMGVDHIAAAAKKLGLGAVLAGDIANQRVGIIPTPAWKQQRYGRGWLLGETIMAAIGQGYVLATPLQLATMTARLTNGGLNVTPHITKQLGSTPTFLPTLASLNINPEHLAIIKAGMDQVINHPLGTAKAAQAKDPNLAFGGKTGTSQVRGITLDERNRGFKIESLGWNKQNHALFVGYAPLAAPRYAVAVAVEHGGSGSMAAAPIARDLLIEVQKRRPELVR